MNKLLLVFVLFIISCTWKNSPSADKAVESELEYYKDSRTNLCFAVAGWGYSFQVMTNVPCTEEVEKQIKLDVAQREAHSK